MTTAAADFRLALRLSTTPDQVTRDKIRRANRRHAKIQRNRERMSR